MRIATPEGVDVELTLAGIGSRFIAAFLDFAIQGSVAARRGVRCSACSAARRRRRVQGRRLRDRLLPRLLRLRRAVRGPLARAHARQALDGAAGRARRRAAGHLRPELRAQRHAPDRLPARRSTGSGCSHLRHDAEPAARRPRRGHAGRARAPRAASRARRTGGGRRGPRRRRLGRQRGLGAGHRHRAPVPRPPQRRSPRPRAPSSPRELERRLRPRVAGAPEDLSPEEFLERLVAARPRA